MVNVKYVYSIDGTTIIKIKWVQHKYKYDGFKYSLIGVFEHKRRRVKVVMKMMTLVVTNPINSNHTRTTTITVIPIRILSNSSMAISVLFKEFVSDFRSLYVKTRVNLNFFKK